MRRLVLMLLGCAIAGTPVTWAQTADPIKSPAATATTQVSSPGAPQSNKDLDCGCESQVLPEALAIVNGARITRQEIEESLREPIAKLKREVIEARKKELDLQINSKLVATEAKRRSVSIVSLLELEVLAKVKEPTSLEAQTFFAQNKDRIRGDFNDVRNDIVGYLRQERETEEARKFAEKLRGDGKRVQLVAATTQEPNRERVLAIVDGKPITAGDIEDSLRPLVYAIQEQVYRLRKTELDLRINDTLLEQAAQKQSVTTATVLAAETRTKSITEEDARAFYAQNKDRVSGDFLQTKDTIIRYLQESELRRAELALVEKLRAAASIETFLLAPKQQTANSK